MDGSSVVESLPRVDLPLTLDTNDSRQPRYSEQQATAPAATTRMAYVVNSIKEGFRKLGAGVLASDHHARASRRRPAGLLNGENLAAGANGNGARRAGGNVWGVKRKVKGLEKQSSFDVYLSSLPKADPVDRTVHWLFHHHDEAGSHDQEGRRERNITSIGDVQLRTALRYSTHLQVL